jgi:hypothetical protein
MFLKTATAAAIAATAALPMAAPARADAAGDFLKGLEGTYRGRGSAIIPGREKSERITCQVTNSYQTGALVVKGECASTQGKTSVSGKLSHSGEGVSGSFIDAFKGASVTKSSGTVKGGRLTVSTNFVENGTGQLARTQQIIRKSGSGFKADFFVYDNAAKAYQPSGSISFSAM